MKLWISVLVVCLVMHLEDVLAEDICFQYFSGQWMTCHGSLPLFSEKFLSQLHQVMELDLLGCNFTRVPKEAFRGLNKLNSLNINCHHKVTDELTFEKGALQHLSKLRLLSLSYNGIRSLPASLLCSTPNLRFLFLAENSLRSLDDLGFGSNCHSSNASCEGQQILTLVLRGNSIDALPRHALCSLRNLTMLDMSSNGLRTIDEHALASLSQLRELDLSANNFSRLPLESLQNMPSLDILDLSDNPRLANVSHVLQHLPKTLKRLNLTNLRLHSVEADYFSNLSGLNSLILDGNGLQTINESVLQPLVGSGMWISVGSYVFCVPTKYLGRKALNGGWRLPFEDYEDVWPGLQLLSLDSNDFTAVPPIGVLRFLEVLSLDHNRIAALNDDDFSQLPFLQVLHLSFNRITTISPLPFSNMTCLREVHLDNNDISHISPEAFDTNGRLQYLFLQFNWIRSIQGMFRQNLQLEKLNLSHNLLEQVSIDALPINLVELDLSANFLKVIGQSEFAMPLHLKMALLDLSHNRITYVSKNFFPVSLAQLMLHNNLIVNMSDCVTCTMGQLKNLTLHDNRLTTVRLEWLSTHRPAAKGIIEVTLRGNPFVCNCHLLRTLNSESMPHLKDYEEWQCRPEYAIGRRPLINVSAARPPEDFLCRADRTTNSSSLPEECTIYHDLSWQFIIADCSNRNLTSIPESLTRGVVKLHFDGNRLPAVSNWTFQALKPPTALQSLYLNRCHIEELDGHAFGQLTELAVLHLEDNRLQRLVPSAFDGLHQLRELFLFSNRLRSVDDGAFLPLLSLQRLKLNGNQLNSFPVWRSLRHFDSLLDISLSDNPWSCDCDFVDQYQKWLQEFSSKVVDVDELFCKYDDNSTSEIPLISFNEANCYDRSRANSFLESRFFPLTVGICSVVVFAVILLALVFVYRKEMQVLIYSRYGVRVFAKQTPEENDADKIFDAFISYSHDDEEFVMNELVGKLEGIKTPFRLCLHHRDFQVGVFITVNIFDAIAKSRRSILVLSDSFMRSEWCRFEFKQAHLQMFRDSSYRVILIVLGDIPQNLDPEMENYMKSNTYLRWGDKLFFERLYFAMPDRKAANDDPPVAPLNAP